jgi:hypothetical protein
MQNFTAMEIIKKISSKRGCGYRKPGGIYLCCDGPGSACGMLPCPLTVCPCCGDGIKQTRGFTWINSNLFGETKCPLDVRTCWQCPMSAKDLQMGLMWVGEKFYPTTSEFNRESDLHGISKRIAQIPHKLKVGETWIALAHPRAIVHADGSQPTAGIFRVFRPQRIEYILTGNETPEQLESLDKRGFTLIQETRDIDTQTELQI